MNNQEINYNQYNKTTKNNKSIIALLEYFNNLTRDSVIYSHETSCSLSCNDKECSWENNPNLVLNYNPDSMN